MQKQSKLFRVGDKVVLMDMMFISYDLNKNIAYLRRGSGEDVIMPLTLAEFGLGKYGMYSRVHPTNLPFSHPDFCTWVGEKKRLVRHTRTGEICTLSITDDFYSTGEYKLVPKHGESKTRTAPYWETRELRSHLEAIKGKPMQFNVKITGILYKETSVNSITLTRISESKVGFYASSLEWDTFIYVPPKLINKYYEETSKKRRPRPSRF
jgi:hypothetical protein